MGWVGDDELLVLDDGADSAEKAACGSEAAVEGKRAA